MVYHLSRVIAWVCLALVAVIPVLALGYLVNLDAFANLAKNNLALPVVWPSVQDWQWFGLWLVTLAYLGVGLAGLFYLHRPFASFARGELFNLANSRDLKRSASWLFAQALAKPLHTLVASLLLSANHGPGEKFISLSFGSGEVTTLAVATVFWVMSHMLVEGSKLQSENRQFV